MKFRYFLSLFALVLCVSLSAQTTAERAGDRAKNRAENRANSKVDQKVDKAVDDAFNAIGGLFKKKNKKAKNGKSTDQVKDGGAVPNDGEEYADEEEARAAMGNMAGLNSGPWEPYTNPYTFSMEMQVTEIKKNGKESTNTIKFAVDTEEFGIIMLDEGETEVSRMILNTQDGKTTMITTDKKGRKSGFRMRMPGVRGLTAETAEDTADRFTFEPTNERKTIDGYSCKKIIVTDTQEGTVTESWVTTELELDSRDIYYGMTSAFGGGGKAMKGKSPAQAMAGGFEGFPIMSTSTDGDKTFISHFRNIRVGKDNFDRSLLSTQGVEIQSLGF